MTRGGMAVLAAVLAWAGSGLAQAAEPPGIEVFSPQGSVKDVRQVAVRFSDPMVALGDPRLDDPFDIDCAASGRGRWADPRNWIYDFEDDLPGGLRCRFTTKPDLETLAGAAIPERTLEFDTGGPAIRASFPREGSRALDEDQVFILALDAPATPESVAAHARCAVKGLPERMPVKVLEGERRAEVLDQRHRLGYGFYRLFRSLDRRGSATLQDGDLPDADRIVVLKCRRPLPPGTEVRLIWGQGIAAPSGIATARERTLAFRTRPSFLVRFECQRTNAEAGCLPMMAMTVAFTAPVPRAQAMAVRLTGDDGRTYEPKAANAQLPVVESVVFPGPFPESAKFTIALPDGLVDDAGRAPQNAERFPLEIATDAAPPLAKFSGSFGILELGEGGVLPVTLRNLEKDLAARRLASTGAGGGEDAIPGRSLRVAEDDRAIANWLRRVEQAGKRRGEWRRDDQEKLRWHEQTGDTSVFEESDPTAGFDIPRQEDARAFEVVGIPLEQPGFYVVELASPWLGVALLGQEKPRYVATAALVTNLAVHFQWGRESSQAWVTTLDEGAPVAGAAIAVSDACSGDTLWTGKTSDDGLVRIAGALPEPAGSQGCGRWQRPPLMVSARTADDMSFTLTSWHNGIAPYDFGVSLGSRWQADIAHTVLDRPLFRAGETVSMKHILRRHTTGGFGLAKDFATQTKVRIAHEGSGDRVEHTIAFDGQGIAESRWEIPNTARLGNYSILIQRADESWDSSGRFRVAEFRVPTMRAIVQGPEAPLVNAGSARLDLFVSYLSGGGASGAPVKLRTLVEPRRLSFPQYEGYSFGGPDVAEGVISSGSRRPADAPDSKARVMPLTLDDTGTARVEVPDLPDIKAPARLVAELEYQDANGEILTVANRFPLWPAALSLGIRTEGWAASTDRLRFRVLVLDLAGKPAAGRAISVALFSRQSYSYRKRLIGGFYAYESTRETKRLDATCAGTTDQRGLVLCEMAPEVSGEVVIRATAADGQGNTALASRSVWVVDGDQWWFSGTNADRMDVLPEKRSYEAGETARFQVRMPFRRATALVTVAREGVVDSFVTELSGEEPVVEVPIGDAYAPNVYVSVLAVRGRVAGWRSWLADLARRRDISWISHDGGPPTAMVDLSKPAFRLGLAKIKVGWKPHRLDVSVTPERSTYRIREQAKVRIKVRRADGGPLPEGTELAVAAVDEGLLELAANRSWNLLDAMMGERGLEVWTSTAQMQVVGKRHYGRKAVPHGGGGGRDRARELFDTLLTWQGRVAVDENGEAEVTIPLNDSLTSFRIAAIATGGLAYFGTGRGTLSTTQDLMAHSGLPPLVRETDGFSAAFTVRNTTDRPMTVEATARVSPDVGTLPVLTAEIAPGQARDLIWPVEAPVGAETLSWDVTVEERGGSARDRLKVEQTVAAAHPVRVYQATLTQLDKPLSMAAERPADAIPGRGGLSITLRPKLGDGLDGVQAYMSGYPYICFEQRASRAIALRRSSLWTAVIASARTDRDGLLKYFPSDWLEGSPTLTTYILAVAHEAGWTIPDDLRRRMIGGLTKFIDGRIVRGSGLPTADLTIRKLAAIEALARYGKAKPAMLGSLDIDPKLWPTSAVLDWLNLLKRLDKIPEHKARLAEAQQIIRARLNFQGTTMGFSTERTDALWWLMISADVNAVRAVISLLDRPKWRADIPRMVRGALGRQQRGHWNTTVANAWGVLAMEKFSAAFEREAVAGQTRARYGEASESVDWTEPPEHATLDFPWEDGREAVKVAHKGTGRPWAIVQAKAALPLREPLFTGYAIKRTVTPVQQAREGVWTRGDVARVTLEIEAQSDMTWVVVDDPVPAGASILGGGLGRDSVILARGERQRGVAWPAFEERRFEAFRAYYRFVPKGTWTVEYTLRLNNPGRFTLPATRVEAMYAPEMFGELPNDPVTVEPAS